MASSIVVPGQVYVYLCPRSGERGALPGRGVQGPATRAPGGGQGGEAPWKLSDFKHIPLKKHIFEHKKYDNIMQFESKIDQ